MSDEINIPSLAKSLREEHGNTERAAAQRYMAKRLLKHAWQVSRDGAATDRISEEVAP